MSVDLVPYPFDTVPSEQTILSLLPPFKKPPIVLFGTRRYWLAVGDSANSLTNQLGWPLNRSKLQIGTMYWVAVERSRLDPMRFGKHPLNILLKNNVIFVG